MKTYFQIALGVCALVAPGACIAADSEVPAKTGRILVLENERTIQGQIEKEGDQYHIRRETGETWVPAGQVLYLCETMEQALQFLRGRANLRDLDERIRLARWCQLHGLRNEALTAAVELKPQNKEALRLLQSLERTAESSTRKRETTSVERGPSAEPSKATPAAPRAASQDPPKLKVNTETMSQFVRRVQPVLMNTCASCHMSGRAGTFKLTRAYDGGMVSRKATQENLNAVLAQINREKWESSPLLVKAVSMHGNTGQPPLKGRQVPAFKGLENWVRATVAENPHLQDANSTNAEETAASDSRSMEELENRELPISPAPPKAPRKVGSFGTGAPVPAKEDGGGSGAAPAASKPVTPKDPFDPEIFNQRWSPKKY